MQRPNWKAMTPAERADAVRPLVEGSLSAAEIARHFTDATRNAVIGVCHRNGMVLTRRRSAPKENPPKTKLMPPPSGQRAFVSNVAPPPPAVIPMPAKAPPAVRPSEPVLFTATVANQCRWPLWGHHERPKADAMFVCGSPTPDGRPYCPHHAEQARGEGTPFERRAVRAALAVRE